MGALRLTILLLIVAIIAAGAMVGVIYCWQSTRSGRTRRSARRAFDRRIGRLIPPESNPHG